MPDANIPLALQSCTFAALGTAGQRCTTTRRLFLHKSIADDFLKGLVKAYKSVTQRIGRPEDPNTLIGPLHSQDGVERYLRAVEKIKQQGGEILIGGEVHQHADQGLKAGHWVLPTIAFYSTLQGVSIIKEETFAPILHVATFETLEEAIELNNGVAQGLSSALFTQNMSNVFQWIGAEGSDCGSELSTANRGADGSGTDEQLSTSMGRLLVRRLGDGSGATSLRAGDGNPEGTRGSNMSGGPAAPSTGRTSWGWRKG